MGRREDTLDTTYRHPKHSSQVSRFPDDDDVPISHSPICNPRIKAVLLTTTLCVPGNTTLVEIDYITPQKTSTSHSAPGDHVVLRL